LFSGLSPIKEKREKRREKSGGREHPHSFRFALFLEQIISVLRIFKPNSDLILKTGTPKSIAQQTFWGEEKQMEHWD